MKELGIETAALAGAVIDLGRKIRLLEQDMAALMVQVKVACDALGVPWEALPAPA